MLAAKQEWHMARDKILKDGTITSVRSRLHDQDKYISGVLKNMHDCKTEHGSAVVRIGTTGEGTHPHYWVEPVGSELTASLDLLLEDDLAPEEEARKKAEFAVTYYKAYHGRSHKQLSWGKDKLQAYSWSSQSMALAEVQQLLNEVRGRKPRKS
jgi:hypothetical protein